MSLSSFSLHLCLSLNVIPYLLTFHSADGSYSDPDPETLSCNNTGVATVAMPRSRLPLPTGNRSSAVEHRMVPTRLSFVSGTSIPIWRPSTGTRGTLTIIS